MLPVRAGGHDCGVVGFLFKICAVGVSLSVAYVFWPRQPSLREFAPRERAALEVEAWQGVAESRPASALVSLYALYAGQYQLAPLDALEGSWNAWRAMVVFSAAADRADQEKALPYLEHVYGVLAAKAGMAGDAQVAARLELFAWMLAGDSRKGGDLATAMAEKLALIYGVPAGVFERSAAALAKGARLRAEGRWSAAMRAGDEGFEALKSCLSTQ